MQRLPGSALTCVNASAVRLLHLIFMNSATADELRQRLADYRRLRTMTWDAQALGAIDAILAETEERLRALEQSRQGRTGGSRDREIERGGNRRHLHGL